MARTLPDSSVRDMGAAHGPLTENMIAALVRAAAITDSVNTFYCYDQQIHQSGLKALFRRGLVTRAMEHGHAAYRITDAGVAALTGIGRERLNTARANYLDRLGIEVASFRRRLAEAEANQREAEKGSVFFKSSVEEAP